MIEKQGERWELCWKEVGMVCVCVHVCSCTYDLAVRSYRAL